MGLKAPSFPPLENPQACAYPSMVRSGYYRPHPAPFEQGPSTPVAQNHHTRGVGDSAVCLAADLTMTHTDLAMVWMGTDLGPSHGCKVKERTEMPLLPSRPLEPTASQHPPALPTDINSADT